MSLKINAATILTIVISCIGLFSQTAFTIGKKRKEIGVRKAYGATIPAVLIIFQKYFGKLVLISSLTVLPSGYYIIRQWLNSYANHVRLTPVYFLTVILIIVVISALTLVFHTIIAVNLNPADALRKE
jgi:putative ABC transport system permease protein